MSRVSLLEQLYAPMKKSALEFNYDNLWAPPIRYLLSQQDIDQLYHIATSLRYNDDIEKKYELIDAVMKPRGFRRGNCGTNRVVYNFLEDTSFCMKIALDRVGLKDSPAEYKNQEYFKPFCCKIFEVDPTGVIACIERVNPISSLEEFISISDDVFNMMVTKIIGKYVVDDLGTEKFMNYGIRYNSNGVSFGPVIIDFPYAYELDGAKLICNKPIKTPLGEVKCGGEIDYDNGLNHLVCCKCGRHYTAMELSKDDSNVLKFYSDESKGEIKIMRARIIRGSDNKVLMDSGRESNTYVSKEEYEIGNRSFDSGDLEPREVVKTIGKKYVPMKQLRRDYYTELQLKALKNEKEDDQFNPALKSELSPRIATRATKNDISDNTEKEVVPEDNHLIATEAIDSKGIDNISEAKEKIETIAESAFTALTNAIDSMNKSMPAVLTIKEPDTLIEVINNDSIEEVEEKPLKEEEVVEENNMETLEKEAFPELNNHLDSNYDDYDEYGEYADFFKDNKAFKRAKKNQKNKRSKGKINYNDMSDY